ncbi:hypothetical protein PoB_002335500 [Plakobranchus ocellatus]|uniref:N-acetylglucosaminylphosphatidylinositol deacetylase n=1 Tax=Plakobranchus ocellatus TaxID=259542 RepID=A0AAV3ZQI1_9GAST|nr:hypothetical protein PoB_002335500 [Plakobranchus ocellatus]
MYIACPHQDDLGLLGPSSGQSAIDGARTLARKIIGRVHCWLCHQRPIDINCFVLIQFCGTKPINYLRDLKLVDPLLDQTMSIGFTPGTKKFLNADFGSRKHHFRLHSLITDPHVHQDTWKIERKAMGHNYSTLVLRMCIPDWLKKVVARCIANLP